MELLATKVMPRFAQSRGRDPADMKRLMMLDFVPRRAVRIRGSSGRPPRLLVAHAIVLAQKGAPNVAPDGTV